MYKQAPNQNRLSHLSEVCLNKVKSFKQLNITDHSQIFQFNQSEGRCDSFSKCGHHCPHEFVSVGLGALLLRLQLQQCVDPLHAQFVLVVLERGKGILQHVRRVGQKDQGENPFVHAMGIVDPLLQNGILHFFDQALQRDNYLIGLF